MRTPRIYTPGPLSEHSSLQLQGRSGHYISRVLRRGPGDSVRLFDGRGGEYEARIVSSQRDAVEIEVMNHRNDDIESPLHARLGLVISRGDRMDWAIQKATELGVHELTPLLSEHCEVKLSGERGEKKRSHWQQIAISACEQCGRNRIPAIATIQLLEHWLQSSSAELNLVFVAMGKPVQHWRSATPKSIRLLIGPEGGLSDGEVQQATTAGFHLASLGPRILRTETAPVAALAVAQILWGDF